MKSSKFRYQHIFYTLAADLIAIILSFFLAYLFRFTANILPHSHVPSFREYARSLIVIIPVFLIVFRSYRLYDATMHVRRIGEIFIVIKAISFAIVILMALTFFYRGLSYSRIYLVVLWIVSILLVSEARYLMIQWGYHRKSRNQDISRTLLIGINRNTRHIIQWSKNNPHYGQAIVGLLTSDPSLLGKHIEGIAISGLIQNSESEITKINPDTVILLDTSLPRERITDLVAQCEDLFIEFKMGADIYGMMSRHVNIEYISNVPLLGFRSLPLDDPWNRFLKRSFDILFSSIFIILSSPLLIFLALCVKAADRGPVFYKQERMGRDQKLFNLYKFRTMKVNAEKETGPVWARQNDNRKTWIGGFMRRWNLDELPQFFNVLRGEMSLVGPRPERPHFISQFREDIPRYMARHKIKSGLTGWAQVNGFRGNTSIHERLKYDLYYMENWSLIFDIEIMVMTFAAFKNAY